AHAVGQALGLLGRRAAATRERLDLDAVGLGRQLRVREVGEEAHLAGAGLPAVAEQERGRGAAILRLVAAVVIDAGRDLAAGLVERHAGAQVDGAAEASFDDLGRGVLVHVHAGHQLGRDLLEAQPTAAVRAEHVAPIELAADEGQAADPTAGAALVRIGGAAVGQRSVVRGGDRVDALVRLLPDLLRAPDAAADAGDDDRVQFPGRVGALRGGAARGLREGRPGKKGG